MIAAVAEGLKHVSDTPGFRTARLTRSIETPTRYVLIVEWDSVEAHTVNFRESENFGRWRAVVGPLFGRRPARRARRHAGDTPLRRS